MNKSLRTKQDTALVLNKSKSTLSITSKILSGKSSLTTTAPLRVAVKKESQIVVDDESWMQVLWDWADENGIPDLYSEGWSHEGFPRDKEELLNLTELHLNGNILLLKW